MNIRAPELSALMTILRSTGPVISTRRSSRSGGMGATFQSPSRMPRVSGRKSGCQPASSRAWTSARRARSSRLRPSKARCSLASSARASGVRISSYSGLIGALISTPATAAVPGAGIVSSSPW